MDRTGVNIQWTAGDGLAIYTYGTPLGILRRRVFFDRPERPLNAATGKRAWSGPFDSGAGSFGPVTGGASWSTPGGDDPGYFGLNLGVGKGPPGVGVTTTNYTKRLRLSIRRRTTARTRSHDRGVVNAAGRHTRVVRARSDR